MAIPRTQPSPQKPDKHGGRRHGKKGHGAKHRRKKVWRDKHWRWVPTPDGDWRVEGFIFTHHHKPKKHHFRGPGPKPAKRTGPAVAPAPAAASGEQRPAGSFGGPFGMPQAIRLLERAGFGPVAGQAEQLVSLGLVGAVQSLTRPAGPANLVGPPPVEDEGNPIAPATAWGHDGLWWLDRMVRSDQPLVERMALVFHDWFATSQAGVSKPQQMIDQSNVFRAGCFGSFLDLFKAVTADPAMLQWLNGAENSKYAPNENYGREMMELFSLGADRGAYTEDDVREQARALTGFTYEWNEAEGSHNFHYVASRHDEKPKTVFGRTGNWGWEDSVRLCVENPLHASFFVDKLWSYFVPTPAPEATRNALISTYVSSGWQIRPLLETILMSPDLYEGAPMVKPPSVQLASMMRRLGRFVDTDAWTWLMEPTGQLLFWPPNVSGWDDTRWLDTSRMRARWNVIEYVIAEVAVDVWHDEYSTTETPEEAVSRAIATWGNPELRDDTRAELLEFARRSIASNLASWQKGPYRAQRQNALLQLIGISPDLILQ
jgi:hypothetical protein